MRSRAADDSERTPLDEAFETAGWRGLRLFLESAFAKDPELEKSFVTTFAKPDTNRLEGELEAHLNHVLFKAIERDEFADWGISLEFEYAYLDAIADYVEPVLRRGDVDAVFDLVEVAVRNLGRLEVDESSGFSTDVMRDCCDYWSRAFDLLEPEQVPVRFNYLHAMLPRLSSERGVRFDVNAEDELESFLVERFADSPSHAHLVRELAEPALEEDERAVADYRAKKQEYVPAWADVLENTAARWALILLRTMRAMGEPVDAMMACAAPYIERPDVALLMADVLAEAGESRRACALLERSRGGLREASYGRHRVEERLLQLYSSSGMREDEKALLRELLLADNDFSTADLLHAYRECWDPGLWPDVRDELLDEMGPGIALCDCLAEEGLGERLVAELQGVSDFFHLDRYEGFLVDAGFTDFVVESWCRMGEEKLTYAVDRHGYSAGASWLARAARFPSGEQPARDIAARIRRANPRKRALKNELSMVGL